MNFPRLFFLHPSLMKLFSFLYSSSTQVLGFIRQHILSLVLLLLSLTIFPLLLPTQLSGGNAPQNITVPALFAFGDSLVDQGNNNHIKTICRCNFPPYGEDFPGGIPTGRFSNGKTPADILAEKFGIKEYLPAYLDPNLQDKDLLTGVSFASGATGLDPQTSKDMAIAILSKQFILLINLARKTGGMKAHKELQDMWSRSFVLSLPDQLKMFKEYIGKLKGIVGEEGTKEILDNGLFAVVVGSNDLAVTYAGTSLRRFQYNISSYTDLLVESASEFLEGLYELGARRIAVHSIPPIGCVPAQRTLSGGKLRKCADKYNEAAEMMNQKLSNEVSSFQNRQSDRKSRVFFLDLYSPFLEIIQNHKKYGFEVADEGCCGKGKLAVGVFCNRLTKTCPNHSAYLFWDSFHPTERGNRIIIGNIFQAYIDNLQQQTPNS